MAERGNFRLISAAIPVSLVQAAVSIQPISWSSPTLSIDFTASYRDTLDRTYCYRERFTYDYLSAHFLA